MIPVANMGIKIPFEKSGDWELYDEARGNTIAVMPAVHLLFNFDEDDIMRELGFG